MNNQLGLYIHVPFCQSKCQYCDFYSVRATENALFDEYKSALLAHIRETAAFAGGYTVNTVYFGGGTPLMMGHARLLAILSECQKRFTFFRGAEITIEVNPDSCDFKALKKLHRGGFNRLSIGVQSLEDHLLQRLGRAHNAIEARHAYGEARRAGFDNISVDLMYGLPSQTREQWQNTLREIISWTPEHISAYGLKLEPSTPLYAENPALPGDDLQADMYLDMVRLLEENGYPQYEVSNFSRPSRESRHNLKYWTLEPYLGFGPAAHSDFSGRRYSYVRDTRRYIDAIRNGDEMIDEMEVCPLKERAGEYVMLGLRTAKGLSGNEYIRQYGVSFDPLEKRLELFRQKGLAMRLNDRWRLTPEGFLLSNQIIGDLLNTAGEVSS